MLVEDVDGRLRPGHRRAGQRQEEKERPRSGCLQMHLTKKWMAMASLAREEKGRCCNNVITRLRKKCFLFSPPLPAPPFLTPLLGPPSRLPPMAAMQRCRRRPSDDVDKCASGGVAHLQLPRGRMRGTGTRARGSLFSPLPWRPSLMTSMTCTSVNQALRQEEVLDVNETKGERANRRRRRRRPCSPSPSQQTSRVLFAFRPCSIPLFFLRGSSLAETPGIADRPLACGREREEEALPRERQPRLPRRHWDRRGGRQKVHYLPLGQTLAFPEWRA